MAVGDEELKILNNRVRHLLAYTDKTCVKFTVVRVENHLYPGVFQSLFITEAQTERSYRIYHKIS